MHSLSVDQQLVATARARGTVEREMAASAADVFATLEDGPSWTRWVPVIREVTWTSPKPFDVGTTRTVKLVGGIVVDEVFWGWETNRSMCFSAVKTSLGSVSALTEVYEVTPISADRCILRWTFAMKFRGVLNRLEPMVGRMLPIVQKRLVKTLERVVRERSLR